MPRPLRLGTLASFCDSRSAGEPNTSPHISEPIPCEQGNLQGIFLSDLDSVLHRTRFAHPFNALRKIPGTAEQGMTSAEQGMTRRTSGGRIAAISRSRF